MPPNSDRLLCEGLWESQTPLKGAVPTVHGPVVQRELQLWPEKSFHCVSQRWGLGTALGGSRLQIGWS